MQTDSFHPDNFEFHRFIIFWCYFSYTVLYAWKDSLSDRAIVSDERKIGESGVGAYIMARELKQISWRWWHYANWSIKIPSQLLMILFMLLLSPDWYTATFYVIISLLVASLHNLFIRFFIKHRLVFVGDDSKPKWYLIVKKLWDWLPWEKL